MRLLRNESKEEFVAFLRELSDKDSILCNDLVFKTKLGISSDTYDYLKKAENLKDFAETLLGAIAGGGGAVVWWWSSAPVLTKFALALGFTSVPLALPIFAAIVGGGTVYLGKRLMKKVKGDLVEEIPKFIKAPIDLLALSILELLFPIVVRIILIDGEVHPKEREKVIHNLVYKWGYCSDIVESYLDKYLGGKSFLDNFSYDKLSKSIDVIVSKDKGIHKESLIQIILKEVKEIIEADGRIDAREMEEYAKLVNALS